MNAAKRIRKMMEESAGNDAQLDVLKDLAMSLQLGQAFELSRLYQIDYPYFKLALTLLDDWRLDHHIASRSKLVERLFCLSPELMLPAEAETVSTSEIVATETAAADTDKQDDSVSPAALACEIDVTPVTSIEATPAKTTRKRKQTVTPA